MLASGCRVADKIDLTLRTYRQVEEKDIKQAGEQIKSITDCDQYSEGKRTR